MEIVNYFIYRNIYHFIFENGKSILTDKESQKVYVVETVNANMDYYKALRLLDLEDTDNMGEWFVTQDRTITRNEIYTAIDMADSIEKYCKIENCPEGFKEALKDLGLTLFHFERHTQDGIGGYKIGAYEDLKDPIFYFSHLNGLKYSNVGNFDSRMHNISLSGGKHVWREPYCIITCMYASCSTFLYSNPTVVITDIVEVRHLYKDFFAIDFKFGKEKLQALYKYGDGYDLATFKSGDNELASFKDSWPLSERDAQGYEKFAKTKFVFKHNYIKENFYRRIEDIRMPEYKKCVEKDYICEFMLIEETTTAKEIAMFVGNSGFQEDTDFEMLVPGNYMVKEYLCSVNIVSPKDFEAYQVI